MKQFQQGSQTWIKPIPRLKRDSSVDLRLRLALICIYLGFCKDLFWCILAFIAGENKGNNMQEMAVLLCSCMFIFAIILGVFAHTLYLFTAVFHV